VELEGSLMYLQEPSACPVVNDVDTGHVLSLRYVSVFIHLGPRSSKCCLSVSPPILPPNPLCISLFPSACHMSTVQNVYNICILKFHLCKYGGHSFSAQTCSSISDGSDSVLSWSSTLMFQRVQSTCTAAPSNALLSIPIKENQGLWNMSTL